jgi:voltage-gated potassium channel
MTEARQGPLQRRIYEIIFEADTPLGKLFDVVLLGMILASVLAVSLDSVESIHLRYPRELAIAEWIFTALFSVELALRLLTVRRPIGYLFSFYGLVDILAILPSYLSLIMPGTQHLLAIRILRLLRVFRVLKLGRYVSESRILVTAIRNSRAKIAVFLFTVLTLVVVIGAAMYIIEGGENGFDSIPRAMYWAIVTLTTVGYGDITPQTVPGQLLSSALMIMGYGLIAIPTGIVTAELTSVARPAHVTTRTCPSCMAEGHRPEARYCFACSEELISNGA